MKKTMTLFVCVIIYTGVVYAQNSGYAGKRFLLKVNALQGTKAIFSGLELEYIPLRHTTIAIGAEYYTSRVKQIYKDEDYELAGTSNTRTFSTSRSTPSEMSEKAKLSTMAVDLKLRQYLNLFRPAPYGTFVYGLFQIGYFDVKKGSYSRSLLEYNAAEEQTYTEEVTYSYKNILFTKYEAGIGHQIIYKRKFSISAMLGISRVLYRRQLNDIPSFIFKGIESTSGGSIMGRNGIGLSGVVQIGYLIF